MHGTDFVRSGRVRDRLAVGYKLRRGRLRPVKDREIAVAPAGSVFSSVEDMARYAAALTRGGEPLLRRRRSSSCSSRPAGLPVLFERGPDGRVEAVRTASTRGRFLRLHRRPRATSRRLWGRAAAATSALAGAIALARRRRRRRMQT